MCTTVYLVLTLQRMGSHLLAELPSLISELLLLTQTKPRGECLPCRWRRLMQGHPVTLTLVWSEQPLVKATPHTRQQPGSPNPDFQKIICRLSKVKHGAYAGLIFT